MLPLMDNRKAALDLWGQLTDKQRCSYAQAGEDEIPSGDTGDSLSVDKDRWALTQEENKDTVIETQC